MWKERLIVSCALLLGWSWWTGTHPIVAAEETARSTVEDSSLAEDLEAYLAKQGDDLPPKVKQDLRALLDKHAGTDKPKRSTDAGKQRPKLKIVKPAAGEKIGGEFEVAVEGEKSRAGEHYWLVVERKGVIWPKEPSVVIADGQWSDFLNEGGSPGKLTLTLISVNEEGHERIKKWFDVGHKTGKYLGRPLSAFKGTRIDSVVDLDYR